MRRSLHKAGWILVKPGVWIENGTVEVVDGRIMGVSASRAGSQVLDHGPGVILPALINAHTHLSLSAFRGQIETRNGFADWVKGLISARSSLTSEEIVSAATRAAQNIKASGTGLVAEVGPLEPGASAIRNCGLEGIVFTEVLGNSCEPPELQDDARGVSFSVAGHGLHTTAPDVLQSLRAFALERNNLFSIHLAESEAETEFLSSGSGIWADFIASRGIDFSHWDLTSERPVQRALRLGLLGPGTLAVHLLQAARNELTVLSNTGTSVCLCPRSNFLLHNRLPDINACLAAGLAPALGTDSLASSPSLSLFDEMAFICEQYADLAPDTMLAFATINGAKALARPDLGIVEPGRRARLIYADIEATSRKAAALQLVAGRPQQVHWL